MSQPDSFAHWVFEKIADGQDEFPAEDLLDEMERRGLVEAKRHTQEGLPGVSVSLFWKGESDED